jgi:hypothetical protein
MPDVLFLDVHLPRRHRLEVRMKDGTRIVASRRRSRELRSLAL